MFISFSGDLKETCLREGFKTKSKVSNANVSVLRKQTHQWMNPACALLVLFFSSSMVHLSEEAGSLTSPGSVLGGRGDDSRQTPALCGEVCSQSGCKHSPSRRTQPNKHVSLSDRWNYYAEQQLRRVFSSNFQDFWWILNRLQVKE